MYGLVLLMAATAGGESANWGCYGYGCYSYGCGVVYSSCYGCGYSTCGCGFSSCHSYGCGVVHSCHGCCGIVRSHHSCCGVVHGCCGVVHSCHGCCGTVIHHGCCGCSGVVVPSCCGSAKPPESGKKIEQDGKKGKGKGGEDDLVKAAPATIEVTLPDSATLQIDGYATVSISSLRRFQSPELQKGKTYFYTFTAEYQHEGKAVKVSKKVQIKAGELTQVDMNQTVAVVSK